MGRDAKLAHQKMTGRLVDAITATGAKQFIPDGAMPGLFLRVTPAGAKTFVLRISHEGERIEYKIGKAVELTPDMARAKAAELIGKLKIQGVNPNEERLERIRKQRVAKENTLASLADGYFAHQDPQKSPRSIADERYRFDRYILPRLGSRPYSEIKRSDVVLIIRDIGAKIGGATANRCHQYMSQILNYAVNGGALDFNPIAGLPKQFREGRRTRFLDDFVLQLIWSACSECVAAPRHGRGLMPRTALAIQLVMLTLQRGHQVREMRREDVCLKRMEWRIPAERMKGRAPFLVPLSDPAGEILADAFSRTNENHIFSNNRRDEPMSTNALNHAVRRVMLDNHRPSAGPHDIRRTGRTLLTSRRVGVNRDIAERVISHVIASDVERRYDLNDYEEERREALQKWAAALLKIVNAPCVAM